MELKEYQKKTLNQIGLYLSWLKKAQEEAIKQSQGISSEFQDITFDFPKAAWNKVSTRQYISHKNGLGQDLPSFYIKIPTGGGKTLLACHTIDLINRDYLNKQTGLVLWIVPTTQIYRQTLASLSNREHPYRQVLDIASAGRTVLLEKTDRFLPQDVKENLLIMLLMLPSASRKNKEVLRVFRDSGGFTDFFPAEDDVKGNTGLLQQFPNLDYFGTEQSFYGKVIKTSLGNVLRILRPIIIIDEGHKAYSDTARKTIYGFNPCMLVELSATPPKSSNILVEISGQELNIEEMIKLDLHITNKATLDWHEAILAAFDKRKFLEQKASEYESNTGQYIRPICLIQVERTGKEQRGKKTIHADDVKDYLIKQCGISEDEVAIKSSEKDDIEGIDLLSRDCSIRYIITKQALQEGWDCAFAYILAVLTNPRSQLSITQLVGRILRQPKAKKTKIKDLDESYVFCFRSKARELLENVRKGFEDEGLGDIAGRVCIDEGDAKSIEDTKESMLSYREKFKQFEGKIYLPKFVRQEQASWRDVNYEMDILSGINWEKVDLDYFKGLVLPVKNVEEQEIVVGLSEDSKKVITEKGKQIKESVLGLDKVLVTRQMIDIVPNPWIAYGIADEIINLLLAKYGVNP
jgi:type III restriction enzyme